MHRRIFGRHRLTSLALHQVPLPRLKHLSIIFRSQTASCRNQQVVQKTALLTCFWRHKESLSADALIDDLAGSSKLIDAFLTAEDKETFNRDPNLRPGVDILAVRTRFIDDRIQEFVQTVSDQSRARETLSEPRDVEVVPQLVFLGAGMDTRAFRFRDLLAKVSCCVFEVDQDRALFEEKNKILFGGAVTQSTHNLSSKDHCSSASSLIPANMMVKCIECDIRQLKTVTLLDNGFNLTLPTMFIIEGLLEHLEPQYHAMIFATLRQLVSVDMGSSPGPGQVRKGRQAGSHKLILQNLEPIFAETFNTAKLPYADQLVSAHSQQELLLSAGWQNVKIHDQGTFAALYGSTRDLEQKHGLRGFTLMEADA